MGSGNRFLSDFHALRLRPNRSDGEKESVNEGIQSDSDEEMERNSEKLTCDHFEKGK